MFRSALRQDPREEIPMVQRMAVGILVWTLIFSLSGMAPSVQAGMIGTRSLFENDARDTSLDVAPKS